MTEREHRYAARATALLARVVRTGAAPKLGDRPATVAALQTALRRRARRPGWRFAVGGGLAAVAAAAMMILATRVDVQQREAAVPAVLWPGDRIPVGGQGSTVTLASGTKLAFNAGSDAEVIQTGLVQWFQLRAGRVQADVAPLSGGQRFVIATIDVEVEVRGTSFEVSVEEQRPTCNNGSHTRVTVRTGVVTVRHLATGKEDRIADGEVWPQDCERLVRRPARRHPASAVPVRKQPAQRPTISEANPTTSRSSLGEQNALFAAAVDARKRGDLREATRKLDRLLAQFPTGPLAETARAQRQRLLVEVDEGP